MHYIIFYYKNYAISTIDYCIFKSNNWSLNPRVAGSRTDRTKIKSVDWRGAIEQDNAPLTALDLHVVLKYIKQCV